MKRGVAMYVQHEKTQYMCLQIETVPCFKLAVRDDCFVCAAA